MCRFIESVCVYNSCPQLLDLHEARIRRTFQHFFNGMVPFHLKEREFPNRNLIKWRIEYDKKGICKEEYKEYQKPSVNFLQLVNSDSISYPFKFLNRNQLSELYMSREKNCDDIIIVKNHKVTDTYYANLAFFQEGKWYTPKSYLLNGIKRQYLISTGQLSETTILQADICEFEKVSLINAMLDLSDLEIPTSAITF